MLDPEDMVNSDPSSRPDEQCIMTYLAQVALNMPLFIFEDNDCDFA